MKVAIVVTTINDPVFLKEYADIDVGGHDVVIIVVGDNKSPNLSRVTQYASNMEVWKPQAQDDWLSTNYPAISMKELRTVIPENSPQRRNFGYLRAMELGADVTIVVDDDNVPITDHWLIDHLDVLGGHIRLYEARSNNGYVNPCSILRGISDGVYARGYPISKMFSINLFSQLFPIVPPVLNAGLWVESPDVDAFTHMMYPNLRAKSAFVPVFLGENQYAPINTQNTSLKRKLFSVFHNVHMQPHDPVLPLDRYDDIWNGLFVLRLIHAMGDVASFGVPLTVHRRNPHDVVADFRKEWFGAIINCKLWDYIRNVPIESKTYRDGFVELADAVRKCDVFEWQPVKDYLSDLADSMLTWLKLTEKWV